MANKQDKALKVIENTLKLLSLSTEQFKLEHQDDSITVQIDLPEDQTGMYIGSRGDSLNSLQLILGLMVSQRLDKWVPISLNINDYKQKREEDLIKLADKAAQNAIELNQEIIIPNLTSYERRIVHSYLAEKDTVKTESRGEGQNRQLFICPN